MFTPYGLYGSRFGSFGLPEIIGLVFVFVVVAAVARRGRGGARGPVLVLRKFEVAQAGPIAVNIEGRPSGVTAWLLTTLGLDTKTMFMVTEREIYKRQASLSGETHEVVLTTEVASTYCSYSQPIWLLIFAAAIVVLGMLGSLTTRDSSPFIAGLLIGGICVVIYLFQRNIEIRVETTGGKQMPVAFKPSVIENVSVNLDQALQVVSRINGIVLARSHGVPAA